MPYWDTKDAPQDVKSLTKEWWQAPDGAEDEHEEHARTQSLVDAVKSLEDSQRAAHEQNLWNARLYSNRQLAAFDWGHGQSYVSSLSPVSLLGENLAMSVVDTLVSRVGKNRTKVTPIPHGASFKVYKNVQRLDRWLWGEFVRLGVFDTGDGVFLDSLIFNFGGAKVTVDEGKLDIRKVFPDDIIVDQAEMSRGGRLKHLYERRCRPIEEVEAEFGLEEGAIKNKAVGEYLGYRKPGRGWCVVVEGYRAAAMGQPGRHFIAVDGGCRLLDEVWEHEWLPYVFYHYNKPVSGWYWPSVVEQVLPYQVRLNEINEVIRDAQDLVARPRLLVAEGSRINPADVDNLVARLIKYTGIAPVELKWTAVPAELYNERDREVRICFEQFGLMQLVSQGKLPNQARLDSSTALQEATDISDDRLAKPMQRFEQFFLDLGRLMIRVMGASGENPETVYYTGGKGARAERIKWKDIDLDDNAYTLDLGAASVFSMTPGARREKLEKRLEKGIITPQQYQEMEENPDLEEQTSLQAAACDDIRRVIELMEEGGYETPIPAQDLVYGVQKVTFAYLRLGRYEDVDSEIKENFLKWIAMARAVMRQGTQTPELEGIASVPATEAPPLPMGPPVGPAGAGMAPMQPGLPTPTPFLG